eukprot:gene12932-8788_t
MAGQLRKDPNYCSEEKTKKRRRKGGEEDKGCYGRQIGCDYCDREQEGELSCVRMALFLTIDTVGEPTIVDVSYARPGLDTKRE